MIEPLSRLPNLSRSIVVWTMAFSLGSSVGAAEETGEADAADPAPAADVETAGPLEEIPPSVTTHSGWKLQAGERPRVQRDDWQASAKSHRVVGDGIILEGEVVIAGPDVYLQAERAHFGARHVSAVDAAVTGTRIRARKVTVMLETGSVELEDVEAPLPPRIR